MEKNTIAKAAGNQAVQKKRSGMKDYVESMAPAIEAALPSVMTPERFTRITLSALSTNPKLQECTPQSFLGAMMTAAQLGLEPNTPLGQAYLIPFRNHGVMECQFQLGYKGMLDLVYRSGEVSIIQAHTVYSNDQFEYELGLDPKLQHKPAMGDRGDPIAYYAVFKTKDGGYAFQVMSVDEVRKHAQKYSKSYGSGPWQTNFDEMAKKTVLKKVLKYAPLKSDFVRQTMQDETIKREIGKNMEDIPDMTIIEVDEQTGEVISGRENGADSDGVSVHD